jgi:hypothetical protein
MDVKDKYSNYFHIIVLLWVRRLRAEKSLLPVRNFEKLLGAKRIPDRGLALEPTALGFQEPRTIRLLKPMYTSVIRSRVSCTGNNSSDGYVPGGIGSQFSKCCLMNIRPALLGSQ